MGVTLCATKKKSTEIQCATLLISMQVCLNDMILKLKDTWCIVLRNNSEGKEMEFHSRAEKYFKVQPSWLEKMLAWYISYI